MPYSLGVDLGTANVAAAVARPDGVRTVALGPGSATESAVVHVGEGGLVALGDLGERRAARDPDGALRDLRHRLGDGATVVVDGAAYAVTALLGAQLRDVVRRVADAEGGPPERVALTVPASWDAARRAAFAEVATDAGVAAPLVVTEAEAAVVAMADRVRVGEVVAVYDLGAGFHVTLVRRGPRGPEIVGRPAGDDRVGGLAFDDAVVGLVAETVAVGGVSLAAAGDDPDRAVALARLHRDCVRAKEALSVAPEAVVAVDLPGGTVEVRLTRTRVEERLRGSIEATTWTLSRTIAAAGLLPSDVASVVLLGGSSRLPLVRQLLTEQFGRPVLAGVDPKLPVAHGAALLAGALPDRAGAARAAGAGPGPAGSGPAGSGPAGQNGVRPDRAAPDEAWPDGDRTGDPGGAGASPGSPLAGAVEPLLDPPTPLLVVPQAGSSRWSSAGGEDRPWRSRFGLPAAAAAMAVLVLAGVAVFASRGTPAPVAPAAVPSASPAAVSTTAPPPTTAPPTTSTSPTATRTPTRTRATPTARPRATTAPRPRASARAPRSPAAGAGAPRATRTRAPATGTPAR